MNSSQETTELIKALSLVQSEMKPVEESARNTFLNTQYATLADIWKAARPICAKHGIVIIQMPSGIVGEGESMRATLITRLSHTSGQFIEERGECPFPEAAGRNAQGNVKGANSAQRYGSAIQYLRRYMVASMLNVVTGSEDDDGNGADVPRPQQSPQRQTGMVRSARWQDLVSGKWRDCACPPASPYHNDQANLGDLQPADLKREWKREYETGSLHPAVVASLADRLIDMAMGELPMALKAAGWRGAVDFDEMAPGDVRAAYTALCNASKEGGAE